MPSPLLQRTATRIEFAHRLRSAQRKDSRSTKPRGYHSLTSYSRRKSFYRRQTQIFRDAADPGISAWFALTLDKDYRAAEEHARQALVKDPTSRFARSTLAEIETVRSRFDRAAYHIQAALHHHPSNGWYRLTLADLHTEAKQMSKAARVLKDAQNIPGLQRHINKRLARIYHRLGKLPTALYWQEKLVSLAPNYLVYA